MIKIAKFGGSSVADAEHFKKIKAIVDADPARRFVVVSACGRRFKGDTKVTDLLYLVNAHVKYHVSCEELLEDIGQRYFDIADELELTYPIREEFAAFAERARSGGYSTEELVSRGEYFTARLMAEYLGLPFLDAATVVAFHHDGTLSMNRTSELVQEYGQQGGFVMPGFYGATREGQIKLLDRGGGDISGSILAKCLGADLYENWTDVSGFYSADPRIVPEAQPIARVTYEELRELSYMGASVLHEEAVFPVREAGIPLVIKNTNAPQDPGTIISETADEGEAEPIITGVTGKRGFVAINVARDRTKPASALCAVHFRSSSAMTFPSSICPPASTALAPWCRSRMCTIRCTRSWATSSRRSSRSRSRLSRAWRSSLPSAVTCAAAQVSRAICLACLARPA